MVESKQQAPHFYITVAIDMAPAMALRKQLNAILPDEGKISVNDLIVKAAGVALKEHPGLNASFAGDEIRYHDQVNIGMAVAPRHGPADCGGQGLRQEIARTDRALRRDVVNRARDGRMQADDMMGSTFTVSNLGMYDVEHFIAIINPPQAAILAVGAVQQTPRGGRRRPTRRGHSHEGNALGRPSRHRRRRGRALHAGLPQGARGADAADGVKGVRGFFKRLFGR